MKTSLALLILCFAQVSFAQVCEVDGISDSPQSLNCTFQNKAYSLRCSKGVYMINDQIVNVAFHMEVETGAVPLVFKTDSLTLTVLQLDKSKYSAELSSDRSSTPGSCSSF